jgi:hypothetical protein
MNHQDLRRLCQQIHQDPGHALTGDRVIAHAREIDDIRVVPGTGAHRIQEVILRRNVLCVLDRAFRVVDGRFRLKGTQSERT